MDIIKPKNDNRNYKFYTLDNNIKCILINDNTLDKSYVVTSVNTGSFANKEYYHGMAHLLEHMCFITSKKYKEKDYLAHKVAEAGGFTNAFTSELNTIYYLDIFTDNLEFILEIFVDFLTNAELKEKYILSELNNVDAEHKKNINDDMWKLFNLERLLSDPNTNFNGFYTGSKETLNKKDIYDKMVFFYKKYYNANNLSICIASNKSIEDLYEISKKYFGNIPKSNEYNVLKVDKPFYSLNSGKAFHMQSISDIKLIQYIFETNQSKNKIYYLLANILNSPEKNLCVDFLKSKGYINSIQASYELTGIFNIKIILSSEGLLNIDFINSYLKFAISTILNFDWFEICNYNKTKSEFLFNNLEKIDTMDLCTQFLMSLRYYSPERIYYEDYNFDSLTKKDIDDLKLYINFDKAIKILVSKEFNYTDYNIDPYYQTKYKEINLVSSIDLNLQKIIYKTNNPYSNIKPKLINNLTNIIPSKISNKLWYGNISQFNEAIIYVSIIFSNKKYFSTPKNYLLTNISLKILNYYLLRELYKAFEYNYIAEFSTNQKNNLIELNLYMYNDLKHIQPFIDNILNLITNKINVSDELIQSKISSIVDNLNSIKTLNPWAYCDYIFNNFYKNSFNYKELLLTLKKIKLNEIKEYINNIISDSGSVVIVYGNIKENNLPNFNIIKNNLKLDLYKSSSVILKKNVIEIHPNKNEKSNCVKISYIISKFDPLINLHLMFLKLITMNIFFEDLRTTKQLGYLVEMYGSIIGKEYYIYQKIQSELSCNIIIDNINEFNVTLIDKIKKIDLNKWIETVTSHLNKKESNTNELYMKYSTEIIQKTYLFNINELMLKHINEVTIDSLCKFITKYILNNKFKSIIQIKSKI